MKLYKIKKSNIDKKGLYASKKIRIGTRIIQYKGKIITNTEVEQNPKFDNERDIYLFDINSRYSLDGDFHGTLQGLLIIHVTQIVKLTEQDINLGNSNKRYKKK